jgi:nucleotide-binding universal stress UspA family protein
MKVVIGVDWSDESFAAVKQLLRLYRPSEVTLVHGIDMGVFEYPTVVQLANLQGYEELRRALTAAGEELLDRTTELLGPAAIKRVNEIGNPAQLILREAKREKADLIVVGARGRGRLAEFVLGSVSHRILMHSPLPTLIARDAARSVERVLVAVEGKEDAEWIIRWLRQYPFVNPVDVCVLSVAPARIADPYFATEFESWVGVAKTYAEDLVRMVAASIPSSHYTVSTRVVIGEPALTVAEEAKDRQLVVVASHGRHGMERFLFGSVSHAVVHRVVESVLVIHSEKTA